MKQTLFTISMLATSAVFATFAAQAGDNYPTKDPVCAQNVQITAPDNGSGIYFDADCTTAYVLPPITGSVSLTGLGINSNLGNCSAINLRMDTIKQQELYLNTLWKSLNAANPATNAGASGNPIFGSGGFGGVAAAPAAPVAPPNSMSEPDIEAATARISETQQLIQQELSYYGQLEGATAQLTYQIQMQKLVDDYQSLNPKIHFERMPLEIAGLNFVMKENGDASMARLPAVISADVPGLTLQVGDQTLTPQGGQVAKPSSDPGLPLGVTFGDALSGQVVLSLMGACPYYDSSSDTIKSDLSAYDIASNITASVQYVYGLEVYRKYHASYNLANLVRHIQEQTTHGGLFTSHTANSIIESQDSSDWFSFNDSSDDPRFQYDDDKMADEIKSDLMDRVVKEISYGNLGLSTAVSTTAPAPDGAAVAAQDLQKCPNLYCQAGAMVLEVANAIAGSSDATATFIKNNNFQASDDVTEQRMLRFYGSFSFTDPNHK